MRAYRAYIQGQVAEYKYRVVNATGAGIFCGVEQLGAGMVRHEIMDHPIVRAGEVISERMKLPVWSAGQATAMRANIDRLIDEMRPPAEHVVTVGINFESWIHATMPRECLLEDAYKYAREKLEELKGKI